MNPSASANVLPNAPHDPPTVTRVDVFVVTLPRDVPYLGNPGPGDVLTANGYLVRAGNRTIYPTVDRSVVVQLTCSDGTVGWGETYGIVAPGAVVAIIGDVLGPLLLGRAPTDPPAIQEAFYDLQRVRGFWGGYWCDAIAALDIALWDLRGKLAGVPVARLLCPTPAATLPAYVSGLPRNTLAERVALAQAFAAQGYSAFKYAAAVSFDGIVEEMAALRAGLGPDAQLMVDLHWKFGFDEAVRLIGQLAPYHPRFVEAPCAPEDVALQAAIAAAVSVPVALGEEWHTVHVARPRFAAQAMAIVQPEMAHTGLSQFMAIGALAEQHGVQVMPHATIGTGIFMAASLQAAAALPNVPLHEYQHSVFDRNLSLLETDMACAAGAYTVPTGPGLGVTPTAAFFRHAQPMGSIT